MNIPSDQVAAFAEWRKNSPDAAASSGTQKERLAFFGKWTAERLNGATRDDLVEIFTPLWSMAMWGSKAQYVDQCIADNGLAVLGKALADLLYGKAPIESRWDTFISGIKRVGPSMASELLAHVHPADFLPWTTMTQRMMTHLGWAETPKYNYQLDGVRYRKLCDTGKVIGQRLAAEGVSDSSLIVVNEFLWWLSYRVPAGATPVNAQVDETLAPTTKKAAEFLHNEVRDKLADIGKWLGFVSRTEVMVGAGARADTVWEATIGNMGRTVYVFEVQTKGSIDSLMINLMKARNHPAVQGVVAVSDAEQIEKIRSHAQGLTDLAGDKLKLWNYQEVLEVHDSLSTVNQRINSLGLVPGGF